VNERKKKEEKEEEEEKRGGSNEDMRGMNQVKEKNKSVRKDVTLLRDETFILFQPCAIRQPGAPLYMYMRDLWEVRVL
jgi:hypothetical protein